MASSKRSDGEGSVYYDKARDRYVAVLVTGWHDGKPIRKKVSATSKTAAAAKLREMRDKVAKGELPHGRQPTVAEWLEHWLDRCANGSRPLKPATLAAYDTYVHRYLIPLLGRHRIDKLTGDHIEAAWTSLLEDGCPGKPGAKPLSATSVRQAHAILSRSLKIAKQRQHLVHNPCEQVEKPSPRAPEMQVLTMEQAQRVVKAARNHRNAARYTVAFTLGLRQGEALGLRWEDIDLDRGILHVRHSLGRVKGKGIVLGEVKSKKGVRPIALPKPLLADLRAHRTAQNAERLAAGTYWHDGDFVFCQVNGKPYDAHADWRLWRERLAEAQVPPARLHAARHTAVTMLLAMGVPPHVVQEIAGHAKFSTTEAYIDRVDALHLDAAEKMAAFWD